MGQQASLAADYNQPNQSVLVVCEANEPTPGVVMRSRFVSECNWKLSAVLAGHAQRLPISFSSSEDAPTCDWQSALAGRTPTEAVCLFDVLIGLYSSPGPKSILRTHQRIYIDRIGGSPYDPQRVNTIAATAGKSESLNAISATGKRHSFFDSQCSYRIF